MTDQPTVAVPAGVILLTDEQAGPLLRTAETIAAVGAWAVDHRQDVLSVSPGMARLMSWPDGQSVFDYLHAREQQPAMAAWQAHLADPTAFTFTEDRHEPLADGQVRVYRVLAQTQRDSDGAPVASTGVTMDVTAVVAARTAVQTSSTVAQALMGAPDTASLLDAFTDAIVNVGGYRYCAYSRPAPVWPADSERRKTPRMATVAFAGSDRWIGQEIERRAALAFEDDRVISLKAGVESVVAPEAMFIPVRVHGTLDGVLSVWADELTLLNGDQTRLLPNLASSLAVGLGRLLCKEQIRAALATSMAMLADLDAIDADTLAQYQNLLDLTAGAHK